MSAQRTAVNSCTSNSRLARYRVEFFLTLPDRKVFREETGATGEKVEQIAIVQDENVCNSLQNFISNNRKFKNIDQSIIDTDKQIYFYKTDNFYYVFWGRKPEFDDRPATGPKTLFIVIKNDLSQFWEYYF
ncbi:hypothetical protein GCM10027429_30330 [Marivirga atlantica]